MTPSSVAHRSIGAAGWMGAGTFTRAVLQVGVQVTFSRTLGPDLMGVFLLASALVTACMLVSDLGFSYRLIQQKEVSAEEERYALTWHIVTATAVFGLLWLAAPYLAAWFGESRLGDVLKPLALVIPLGAAGATALNLLKRDLNFKAIQIALLWSYLIGYALVGILATKSGAGIFAPLLAWLTQAALYSLILYAQKPHAGLPLFTLSVPRPRFAFGTTFLFTNVTNWLITNVDRLVLGRVAGTTAVGLYATPFNHLSSPTQQVITVIQPVLFSASARLQGQNAELRRAYLAVTAAAVMFVAPVFAGIAAIAPTLVSVLYGQAWTASVELARPLALAMPCVIVWAVSTPILWNTNQRGEEYKRQLPLIPVWIAVASFASTFGPIGVAWGLLAMQSTRAYLTLRPALRALDLKPLALFQATRGGLIASAVVAFDVAVADACSRALGGALVTVLVADFMAGILGFCLLLRICPGLLAPELKTLLKRVLATLPSAVATALKISLFPGLRS
jgi:lipopolysaccharide exporter